jgi:maleylpyruvate isomerase
MPRTFPDARRWTALGTEMFIAAVSGLDDAGFSAPSLLPGWTRKHLAAHVSANAEAVGRLVHWAATGVETPMYRSAADRAEGIARGPAMAPAELDAWLRASADGLAAAMDALGETAWAREVVTAQGRTVPASETPWMRAREVCVHTVDLGLGVGFADLPDDFNRALCADIRAKRGLAELPAAVLAAPLPETTAWLAGRPHAIAGAPDLGPWL